MRAALAAVFVAALCASTGLSAPLNIVHVVMDDGGYNDLGLLNSSRGLITPAIDSIAKDALRFSAWHVQPICSPTRSALMT
jgi:arylsulfatase